jgi:anti-sigma factor ChrR (cupin superfamily)
MIHQRLRAIPEVEVVADHPDEDTICAFIEGRLEEAASSEMVSHLIMCGSCRRITAQSTRLDSQVSTEDDAPLDDAGPSRLRSILEGLAARVIPESQEDVVFAYQNPPEQESEKAEPTRNEPKETDPD